MHMTVETPPDRRPLATFLHAQEAEAEDGAIAAPPASLPAADASAGTTDPASTELDGDSDSDSDSDSQSNDEDGPSADEPGIAPPSLPPRAAAATASPAFLRGAQPATRTPRWQWLLVIGLTVLLLLQIAVADRNRLAGDAATRPLVDTLCTLLRCALPAWHEPAAYTMLQRDVRPLSGQAGVLQVQASFRNDARWAQAWPALQLSLSDADGRVIGRRTLQPADYLGPGHDPQQRLQPGQSAQITFLLREPSAATVAYSFDFR